MPLRFHAAPPDGQWINDPNALFRTAEGYRLLVQHRADAPDFRATGWGAFDSPDLLRWTWAGEALPPEPDGWAYSGSAVRVGPELELFHTVHDPRDALQHQRRLYGDGRAWRRCSDDPTLAQPIANRRDPFVFAWGGEWRMLLTRSCDWHGWSEDAPSHLVVLASPDRVRWREVGRIGPWDPPGVMWEVPVLTRIGDADVLLLSLVDRRGGGAVCSVRGWVGTFEGDGFSIEPAFPTDGQLLDLGPDFYAMVPGVEADWPGTRPFVAWTASWETARLSIWPGFAGGPISLPRRLDVRREGASARLAVTPWPELDVAFCEATGAQAAGRADATVEGDLPFSIVVAGEEATLRIEGDPESGRVSARREAEGALAWSQDQVATVLPTQHRALSIYIDGPLIEVFDRHSGTCLTAALPGGVREVRIAAAGRAAPVCWSAPPR